MADADIKASTILAKETFSTNDEFQAANAAMLNALDSVPPPLPSPSEMATPTGEAAMVRRRDYDVRMSMARKVWEDVIARRSASTMLTPEQKAFLTASGLVVPANDTVSWTQATGLEVGRRYGNKEWNGALAAMPPASVAREGLQMQALEISLQWETYKLLQSQAMVAATLLALQSRGEDDDGTTTKAAPALVGGAGQ
jgi:hypothetical protein